MFGLFIYPRISVQCSVHSTCCGKFHSFLFNFYTNFHLWPCTKEILPFIFYLFKNKNKYMYLLLHGLRFNIFMNCTKWNESKKSLFCTVKKSLTKLAVVSLTPIRFLLNFIFDLVNNKKILRFILHLFSN